jgi:hypothetical protein
LILERSLTDESATALASKIDLRQLTMQSKGKREREREREQHRRPIKGIKQTLKCSSMMMMGLWGRKPNLGLGLTSYIELLDTERQNTCNSNTTAPWNTMATRSIHLVKFSTSFLNVNGGLIHLVQTTNLPHLFLSLSASHIAFQF